MKVKIPFLKVLTPLIVSVIVSALIVFGSSSRDPSFFFEITFKTSTFGLTQLFYDIGSGHNEAHSVRIRPEEINVFVTYRFPLPEGNHKSFRFDPINKQATITLSSAKILRSGFGGIQNQTQDEVIRSIPASKFLIANQINSLKIDGDWAQIVTTENANDPILLMPLDKPLLLKFDKRKEFAEKGTAFVLITILIWFFGWLARGLAMRHRASIKTGLNQLVLWANTHSYVTIVAIAILAAILSCHPVVFFGKSFVSPDNGTPLLYDKYPTLPGYTTTEMEDAKGADLGALMWQHVSFSVIQSKAILDDVELPLWNRFNSAGTILLGESLSMLGDPLNIGVLLAKGASWAWDIKFVAAKMLFALGLGLTVFAVTRHLAVSLILTISSVYIGFFAYRFNHPAIFSLCYSPWILYFWIRFVQIPADKGSTAVFWLSGLILANWTVMNSGTAKEAYILLIFLNFTGLLIFLFTKEKSHIKVNKGVQLLLAQALFVMISAPVWVTFLGAIQNSYSAYNVPAAIQISPALFIGLFEDMFYRQLLIGEAVYAPSINFLVLFGLLWAIVRVKQLILVPAFLAICFGAAISFSLAFGVVPPSVITKVPFLGNVIHIGNTFSVVLVVHLIVLAGFGLKVCWEGFAEKRWPVDMAITIAMLGILLGFYFYSADAAHSSTFFKKYGVSLLLSFVMLPLLAKHLFQKTATPRLILLLLLCFIALHWRHGMYLKTNVDDYVMNPQVRVNLQAESAAIEFVKRDMKQPFRVVGFGGNLFPGYNGAIGVESIYGANALSNPFYRELTDVLPVELVWGWRMIVQKETLPELKPAYDFLNVGYYLSLSSRNRKPADLPGLEFSGRHDLDVYRSSTVWPRAFFTNQLIVYKATSEFVNMILNGDGRPFAAVQDTELVESPSLKNFVGAQRGDVVPATNYKLTNNTTTFTITVPGKGIITLSEAYLKDDFRVTLNGKPADYFRINHAFKGVEVNAPGTYTVGFSYWPRYFSGCLFISGIGFSILLIWLICAWMRSERTGPLSC